MLFVLLALAMSASGALISFDTCPAAAAAASDGHYKCSYGSWEWGDSPTRLIGKLYNDPDGEWVSTIVGTEKNTFQRLTIVDGEYWKGGLIGLLDFFSQNIDFFDRDFTNTFANRFNYLSISRDTSTGYTWWQSEGQHWYDCSRQDCPQGGEMLIKSGGVGAGTNDFRAYQDGVLLSLSGITPFYYSWTNPDQHNLYGDPKETVLGDTPEPGTFVLLGGGFLALAVYRRRRK
jgi:hypothetical protein